MTVLAISSIFAGLTTSQSILLVLALAFGFYMAWNIGANDVANAMGTSVGSGALTLKWAIILAAIFEFGGAYLVGSNVSQTIRQGIFDPSLIEDPNVLAMGMIASLLAAGVWLQVASYFGWPVSTTHSIVGAVVGFGCVSVGISQVNWAGEGGGVAKIAASWVVSPVLAGSIAYLMFRFVQRSVLNKSDPVAAAKRITPFLVFFVMLILTGVTAFKGMKNFFKQSEWAQQYAWLDPKAEAFPLVVLAVAVGLGLVAAGVSALLVRRIEHAGTPEQSRFESAYVTRSLDKARKHLERVRQTATGDISAKARNLLLEIDKLEEDAAVRQTDVKSTHQVYRKVEKIFAYLQILSACFVAFAHGANDVANAIGPLSAAVQALQQGAVAANAAVPTWALLLGGAGIVFGLATWGWRVMQTIGKKITELTPTRGFCAELAAATTILIASLPFAWAKVPISTTHTLVGAVLGVGMARGIGAINLNTVRDIAASWVITIPAGAGLSIVIYYMLSAIF